MAHLQYSMKSLANRPVMIMEYSITLIKYSSSVISSERCCITRGLGDLEKQNQQQLSEIHVSIHINKPSPYLMMDRQISPPSHGAGGQYMISCIHQAKASACRDAELQALKRYIRYNRQEMLSIVGTDQFQGIKLTIT